MLFDPRLIKPTPTVAMSHTIYPLNFLPLESLRVLKANIPIIEPNKGRDIPNEDK